MDRHYNYKQAETGVKRVPSERKGGPPGQNNGKKIYHLDWVQHWWCFEEALAEEECRPINYTLVHEPPAPDSGQH